MKKKNIEKRLDVIEKALEANGIKVCKSDLYRRMMPKLARPKPDRFPKGTENTNEKEEPKWLSKEDLVVGEVYVYENKNWDSPLIFKHETIGGKYFIGPFIDHCGDYEYGEHNELFDEFRKATNEEEQLLLSKIPKEKLTSLSETKIEVTPETTEEVQKMAFELGCEWVNLGKNISHTDKKYLFFNKNKKIQYGKMSKTFNDEEHKQITIDQIRGLVKSKREELPKDNWYVVVTEENREIVKDWVADKIWVINIGACFGIFGGRKSSKSQKEDFENWKEVTTEQFKQIIGHKEKPKFKVGDKLEIVAKNHGHGFKIGEITTVMEVRKHNYLVESNDDYWHVEDDEVKLSNPEKPEFKEGQVVKIVGNDVLLHFFKVGELVKINSIYKDGIYEVTNMNGTKTNIVRHESIQAVETYMEFEVKKYEEPYPIVEVSSNGRFSFCPLRYLVEVKKNEVVVTDGYSFQYIRRVPKERQNFA